MRALVIDDSRTMRLIIKKLLRDVGFQVAEAENGADALTALRAAPPPDLVLVDWNMPVMNGVEFIQAVRADPTYAQLPIVMVTTETELTQVEVALSAGASEYVMKPFTKEVIIEKLNLLGLPLPAQHA